MPGRFSRFLSVVATVCAGLAIVRVADAVGKRELVRASREVRVECETVQRESDSLLATTDQLGQNRDFLSYRIAFFSKREPYLVLQRDVGRLVLAVQDRTLLETRFRVQGPADAREAWTRMPRSTLEVLGLRTDTDWYKPDWFYRLEGVIPPADSAERLVRNAFGAGEIFLGGDIVIHGKAFDGIPPEAIDHSYIELDESSLETVLGVVKPGTLVLIR